MLHVIRDITTLGFIKVRQIVIIQKQVTLINWRIITMFLSCSIPIRTPLLYINFIILEIFAQYFWFINKFIIIYYSKLSFFRLLKPM